MNVDQVRELYSEGLSAREVGKRLGKTVWQVIKFMKKHNIFRRTSAATNALQFMKRPLSYSKKLRLSTGERQLFQVGISLYWAEGAKADPHTVDFANSDVKMVLVFLKMLRTVYRVDENRLRVLLYCYGNQNVDELITYWSGKLQLPRNQFISPYVRQDYNPKKVDKMPHGLVHVRYSDMRLLNEIKAEIDIIKSTSWDGGVDNHTSL